MVLNNLDVCKKLFLQTQDLTRYHTIKVIVREKDLKDMSKARYLKYFGSHHEKVFWEATVSTAEEFDVQMSLAQFLFEEIENSRIYFSINPKDTKKIFSRLLSRFSTLMSTFEKVEINNESKIPRSILRLGSSVLNSVDLNFPRNQSYSRYILLDIDEPKEEISQDDERFIKDLEKSLLRLEDRIHTYKTVNGRHIIVEFKDFYQILREDFQMTTLPNNSDEIGNLTIKKDAMMLVMARK